MSLVYAYPYNDFHDWYLLTRFGFPWQMGRKGYKVLDSDVDLEYIMSDELSGVYIFEKNEQGHVDFYVHDSIYQKPVDTETATVEEEPDILAVSMICSDNVIIPVTEYFMSLYHNGIWFSGFKLYVKELLPYLCEMVDNFEPLCRFEKLKIVYHTSDFDIKENDFTLEDLMGYPGWVTKN